MISADILTYFENYTKITEEERAAKKAEMGGRNQQLTIKNDVMLCEVADDLMFGIWANVTGKSVKFTPIPFGGKYIAQCPIKNASEPNVMRCIWTAYD